jgi:hypothetical protein
LPPTLAWQNVLKVHWHMNNNQDSDYHMNQYLDGELAGAELVAFEKELANNTAKQVELENLQVARIAVQHYGLKSQVAAVHHSMMKELKAVQDKPADARIYSMMRNIMRVAAVGLLFIIALGVYEAATISSAGLLKEKYLAYDLNVERGNAAIPPIEQAYLNHDYSKTINEFKNIKSPTLKNNFVAGQAYLAEKNAAAAVKEFTRVLTAAVANNTYQDDTEYYLALSYLANNQPYQAAPMFKKIYNDKDHLYHSKVTYWTMLRLKLLIFKSRGN